MKVKKFSGELVDFNPRALKRSLTKSGANKQEVEVVFDAIETAMYDGIPTSDLYTLAFKNLKKYRNSYAARYSLKKALRELGPEGYFFEKWMVKLFESLGFQAAHSETVQGRAVTHEIDVVAYKDDHLLFCECKFRNDVDAKISVTTPMYFLSRMRDVEECTYSFFGKEMNPTKGFLVTNAYLTTDSIDFANYYGIGLISWDYPVESSIKERVDSGALYPVTCLTTLTDDQEKILLAKNCILVKELVNQPSYLDHLNLSKEQKRDVLEEAKELIDIDCLHCETEDE